jgi:hypothetical protein
MQNAKSMMKPLQLLMVIFAVAQDINQLNGLHKSFQKKLMPSPSENTIEWLVQNNFIPEYFLNIKARLQQLRKDIAIVAQTAIILNDG